VAGERGDAVPGADPGIDGGVVDRIEAGVGAVDRHEERQQVHTAEGSVQRTGEQ